MNEVLGWFGSIMEAILDLLPRRVIVDTREGMIKFRRGKKIINCGPGIWWYWPFLTVIEKRIVALQPAHLPDQTLTTSDGQICKVGAVFTFRITDLVKAITTNAEIDEIAVNEAMAAVQDIVSSHNYDYIRANRKEIKRLLNKKISESLFEYGIEIHSAALTDFCRTWSINLSGIPINQGVI
jgi:regulator of protease activity HflC (stomatin/prohibitin superfamily)